MIREASSSKDSVGAPVTKIRTSYDRIRTADDDRASFIALFDPSEEIADSVPEALIAFPSRSVDVVQQPSDE